MSSFCCLRQIGILRQRKKCIFETRASDLEVVQRGVENEQLKHDAVGIGRDDFGEQTRRAAMNSLQGWRQFDLVAPT